MPKTKKCGDCRFHLKRDLCPRAIYKSHKENLLACLPSDKACEMHQSVKSKKEEKELIKHHPGFAKDGVVFEQIADAKFAFGKNLETDFVFNFEDCVFQPLERCPWPLATDPVAYGSSHELWEDIRSFIFDHLFLPCDELYDVLSSWVLATWLRELWTVVPYVFFYGPVASGKTRGLETLRSISYRGILASNISPAALFRASEEWHPTLFLDEAEIYNKETKTEVVGLLNSGYRKGQYAIRVKQTQNNTELKAFDVFGFKALGGTQGLAQSLESRSIMVKMIKAQRKVERAIDEERATELRNKLLGWRLYTLAETEFSEVSELFKESIDHINFGDGRLQELFSCLLSVSNKGQEKIKTYAKKLFETRSLEEKTGEEAEIIEIITKNEVIDEKNVVLTKDIAEIFNSTRKEKEHWKTRSIGWIIRRLGFDKVHTEKGNGWLIDNKRLKHYQQIYGLIDDSTSSEQVQKVQKAQEQTIENAFFPSCFICHKPLPEDLAYCTYLDSKPIHLQCYKKLEKQKRIKNAVNQPKLRQMKTKDLVANLADGQENAMEMEG